ncbi:hypothetical protein ANN_02341 [Periplaneta americana]|uniref:DUF4817 domain-containing protein n=1 Tax=Periplaneta americana TaxID=6978 RepID=A0ABQ8TXS0_PERAM|nr:hypothetical protein ANN_02341 [Periplaneta americana]
MGNAPATPEKGKAMGEEGHCYSTLPRSCCVIWELPVEVQSLLVRPEGGHIPFPGPRRGWVSVDGIDDSEMRPTIRYKIPDIRLMVGENLGKNPTRYNVHKAHAASDQGQSCTKKVVTSNDKTTRKLSFVEANDIQIITVHIKSTTLPCEAILVTNSITATQRAYQREFGVRNLPKRNIILGLVNKLETTGSLVSEKGKHRSSRLPMVDVRARLEQSPKKSLRRLSQETGYTYSLCQRAAKSFFDDRIISRNLWPPRSPDLTTPDFFLWGYLKDRVYATRPQTVDDLKHNITQEIQAIDNRVLQRVASNMERRVELCLMQDGGHFQHLL